MAVADLATPVLAAAEQAAATAGLTLYDSHKAALIAWITPIVNANVEGAMTTLAAHLTLNGFARVMQSPARNAITGSETSVAALLDADIVGAAAWVDTWLASIVKGT